ncbi:MAG TPA: ferritin-like domain-containing protein [Myxococcales bacterium]|nr:ferritin-like domain-containing protein [Myxococcales bacterium]
MLLTREEMTFDFGGARLRVERDRRLLGWMMNQFLYGEVTGIQCGHWLYDAPDLDAARFFSRQAVEEFQHVDNFVRILSLLGEQPAKAHPMVRFLTSGMMPATFEEHVCLEMALGEGFVLMALYGVIDTIEHDGVRQILQRAVKQEERHVDFGERRTVQALASRPSLRRRLLGLSLVSTWGVRRLGQFMKTRLPAEHEVLRQLPAFLDFTVACAEKRLLRMGVLAKPLSALSLLEKSAAVAEAYGASLLTAPLRKLLPRKRLTDTYLRDPALSSRDAQPDEEPLRLVR